MASSRYLDFEESKGHDCALTAHVQVDLIKGKERSSSRDQAAKPWRRYDLLLWTILSIVDQTLQELESEQDFQATRRQFQTVSWAREND